jgi:exodeoxyribonuclease VII large subunit
MLDPANVLKRGYTITTKEGMIIKNSGQLTRDDQIETIFSDGKIKSQVTENIKVKR